MIVRGTTSSIDAARLLRLSPAGARCACAPYPCACECECEWEWDESRSSASRLVEYPESASPSSSSSSSLSPLLLVSRSLSRRSLQPHDTSSPTTDGCFPRCDAPLGSTSANAMPSPCPTHRIEVPCAHQNISSLFSVPSQHRRPPSPVSQSPISAYPFIARENIST